MKKFKQLLLSIFLAATLLVNSVSPVLAIDPPAAPSAPSAPTAPVAPSAPAAPTAPEPPKEEPKEEPKSPPPPVEKQQEPEPVANNEPALVETVTTGNTNQTSNPVTQLPSNQINNTNSNSTSTNTTTQENTANVTNTVSSTVATGNNIVSKNTGSNAAVTTGDANVSGVIVNSLNTNLDGAVIAEFNIADNHTGDIVLTPNNASSIVSTDAATFQSNVADVGGSLVLAANSGNNITSQNTGGDSSIVTGNANVSGSALNFVNNNASGGILYNVVNIYGQLAGDIILPESVLANGADSTNTATQTVSQNTTTNQTNTADIANNLALSATTGNNDANMNTSGDSSVESGQANVVVRTLTVANSNVTADQPLWIVLINEAGKWVGRIVGSADGSTVAASPGTTITNSSATTNATTIQNNLAKIVTDLNLSANTGHNMASQNTGGDSTIQTGNANIIANIINLVNNNIAGDSRLVVTVVNVFGQWFGDFVPAGQKKSESKPVTQSPSNPVTSDNSNASNTTTTNTSNTNTVVTDPVVSPNVKPVVNKPYVPTVLAGTTSFNDGLVSKGASQPQNVMKINLAWLLVIIPMVFLGRLIWRRRYF